MYARTGDKKHELQITTQVPKRNNTEKAMETVAKVRQVQWKPQRPLFLKSFHSHFHTQ